MSTPINITDKRFIESLNSLFHLYPFIIGWALSDVIIFISKNNLDKENPNYLFALKVLGNNFDSDYTLIKSFELEETIGLLKCLGYLYCVWAENNTSLNHRQRRIWNFVRNIKYTYHIDFLPDDDFIEIYTINNNIQ